MRRAGVRRRIDLDVLMASAAIPFIFPAGRVDGDYYGDGAMRQLAPLSPAVHLGANRVLVVGTRAESPASAADGAVNAPPSPGHLLGFVLDSVVHRRAVDRPRAPATDQFDPADRRGGASPTGGRSRRS